MDSDLEEGELLEQRPGSSPPPVSAPSQETQELPPISSPTASGAGASSPGCDLFVIDAQPEEAPPERTWSCAVCKITIRVREDSHAIEMHVVGKKHQKELRKLDPLDFARLTQDQPEE